MTVTGSTQSRLLISISKLIFFVIVIATQNDIKCLISDPNTVQCWYTHRIIDIIQVGIICKCRNLY